MTHARYIRLYGYTVRYNLCEFLYFGVTFYYYCTLFSFWAHKHKHFFLKKNRFPYRFVLFKRIIRIEIYSDGQRPPVWYTMKYDRRATIFISDSVNLKSRARTPNNNGHIFVENAFFDGTIKKKNFPQAQQSDEFDTIRVL